MKTPLPRVQKSRLTPLFIVGGLLLVAILLVNRSDRTVDLTRSRADTTQPLPSSMPNTSLQKIEGKLLDQIPDIPLYPGVEIDYSYEKRDGNKVGYEMELKTPDTATEITNWYLTALPAAGWTLVRTPESIATITPPGPPTDIEFMIVATKDDTKVNLIIENEGGAPKSEIYAEFPLREE